LTQYGVMMIQYGAAPLHNTINNIPTYGFLQILDGGVNSLWSTAILSTHTKTVHTMWSINRLFTRCDPSTGTQSA